VTKSINLVDGVVTIEELHQRLAAHQIEPRGFMRRRNRNPMNPHNAPVLHRTRSGAEPEGLNLGLQAVCGSYVRDVIVEPVDNFAISQFCQICWRVRLW